MFIELSSKSKNVRRARKLNDDLRCYGLVMPLMFNIDTIACGKELKLPVKKVNG